LEQENARLKKVLAERVHEIGILKEVAAKKVVSVPARRCQVALARQRGLSERQACTLLNVARSALHYRSRMAQKDQPAIEQMRELSAQYPRYGYRRIQIFMQRAGEQISADRSYRLWAKAGLQVPRKRPRRRVASTRPRALAPAMANQVWAYDLVFDACANGQQLKCLTVVDEYT
jgi:putative transposase